jgi:hypothetical protein
MQRRDFRLLNLCGTANTSAKSGLIRHCYARRCLNRVARVECIIHVAVS